MALLQRPAAVAPVVESLLPRKESPRGLPLGLWALMALAVGLAAFFAIAQSSQSTAAGYRLRQLAALREERLSQVRQAEAVAAQMASLDWVTREAQARWNMAPPQTVEYVNLELSPSAQAIVPSRFRPPEQPATKRPWWEEIRALLPWP